MINQLSALCFAASKTTTVKPGFQFSLPTVRLIQQLDEFAPILRKAIDHTELGINTIDAVADDMEAYVKANLNPGEPLPAVHDMAGRLVGDAQIRREQPTLWVHCQRIMDIVYAVFQKQGYVESKPDSKDLWVTSTFGKPKAREHEVAKSGFE